MSTSGCAMAIDGLHRAAAAAAAAAVDDASLLASQSSCSIAMRLVGMPQGTFAECVATGMSLSRQRCVAHVWPALCVQQGAVLAHVMCPVSYNASDMCRAAYRGHASYMYSPKGFMQAAFKFPNTQCCCCCCAAGCHFSAGRPSFVCDGVTCGCPKGCPSTYLKTFQDVSGAVTLTCDATGQDCSIVVSMQTTSYHQQQHTSI
jgi:hypothetical protein